MENSTSTSEHVPIKAEDPYGLETIVFLEGSNDLVEIPEYLKSQLALDCVLNNTTSPSCVETKWAPDSLSFSEAREPCVWLDGHDRHKLLAARYEYRYNQQLIVVKAEGDSHFNNSRAAIVTCASEAIADQTEDDPSTIEHTWEVWDPTSGVSERQVVYRSFIHQNQHNLTSSIQAETSTITEGPTGISGTHSHDESEQENPRVKRRRLTAGQHDQEAHADSDSTGVDSIGHNQPPRTMITRSLLRQLGQPAPTTNNSSGTNDAGDGQPTGIVLTTPSSRHLNQPTPTTRRPRVANTVGDNNPVDIIATRSDGTRVKLVCRYCNARGCATLNQWVTHMKRRHNYKRLTPMECADRWGVPVAEESQDTASSSVPGPVPSQQASASAEARLQQAKFEFRKAGEARGRRIRPFNRCDTAAKVYAEALCAEVARTSTMILTARVDGGAPVRIMRCDDEDWGFVLGVVGESAADTPIVVITVEGIEGVNE